MNLLLPNGPNIEMSGKSITFGAVGNATAVPTANLHDRS
jgi:hypothetical protein